MRAAFGLMTIIAGVLGLASVVRAENDELGILTFPIGVVVGEQTIEVDLGVSGAPARLFLDGKEVCSLSRGAMECTVDLGAQPTIHLLELIRRDSSQVVTGQATRWINRPGQEAELRFLFTPRDTQGVCRGKLLWLHPLKQRPALLRVEHNGRGLRLGDGHSFAFPCLSIDEPHLLTASAIFPDGRRAETVTMIGGFGGSEGVDMTAAPLVADMAENTDCTVIASRLESLQVTVEKAGFEVVFVFDPRAGYRGLLASAGSRYSTTNAWQRADASLFDADQIWFVRPDDQLSRVNGFGGNNLMGLESSTGKIDWLTNLFTVASLPFDGRFRLADAVAASGLVAAAGPRRRAIVLMLGDGAKRDHSLFNAVQARAYLAEIGVPLLVLRTGKVRDDGWPPGIKTLTMRTFATALEGLKTELDRQCVTWFRGELRLDEVAAGLPPGIAVAGRENFEPDGS